jgi:hypothetical protein
MLLKKPWLELILMKERDLVISRSRFLIVIIRDNRQGARIAKKPMNDAKPFTLAVRLSNCRENLFLM